MMDDRTAVAWARDELAQLVAIPSFSGAEGEVIDHLRRRAGELGLPCRQLPTPGGHPNLVLGASRPDLVIVAHVDTIRPDWDGPGDVRVEGSTVHGLGAVDDKGGVVACLQSLVLAGESGVDLERSRVAVAFSVDEEVGGTGSMALAAALEPRFAIALEGTQLQPAPAEVGFVDARISFTGRSAHGARFELGDNAVHKAGEFISGLSAIQFDIPEHPLLGRAATTVIHVAGGSPENTIPDYAELTLTTRVVPPLRVEGARARLLELVDRVGGEYHEIEVSEPFETEVDSRVVCALRRATEQVTGSAPEPCGMWAWTDAHSFYEISGSEAVVYGPGDLGLAHRPDERIDAIEVVQCARVFELLIGEPSLWSPPTAGVRGAA